MVTTRAAGFNGEMSDRTDYRPRPTWIRALAAMGTVVAGAVVLVPAWWVFAVLLGWVVSDGGSRGAHGGYYVLASGVLALILGFIGFLAWKAFRYRR